MARKIIQPYTIFYGPNEIEEEQEVFGCYRAFCPESAITQAQAAFMTQRAEEGMRHQSMRMTGPKLRIVEDGEFEHSVWFRAVAGRV